MPGDHQGRTDGSPNRAPSHARLHDGEIRVDVREVMCVSQVKQVTLAGCLRGSWDVPWNKMGAIIGDLETDGEDSADRGCQLWE
jgi:hypothetical protein